MDKPKIKRPGSGRTTGSFSFVKVSLKDLTDKFLDPTQEIIVGRKWAEGAGFKGLSSASSTSLTESIEGKTPATKITAKVVDFDS